MMPPVGLGPGRGNAPPWPPEAFFYELPAGDGVDLAFGGRGFVEGV